MAARADALSVLQNLGRPLSRVGPVTSPIPWETLQPALLDFSLDTEPTRIGSSLRDVLEFFPVPQKPSHKESRP